MDSQKLLGLVAVWLIAAIAVTHIVPLADDELYYWCWSKELQLSYYDHAPLVAWLIAASTSILGDGLLGVRLPAVLCMAGTLVAIGILIKRADLLVVLMLCPLFSLGAGIITPDAPLLLFWSWYVVWNVRLHERLDEVHRSEKPARSLWFYWLLGGVVLGLGGLGKYTMALAVGPAFLAFLGTNFSIRRWLPGFVEHGLVAVAVASPILIFNYQEGFAPILYQWSHAMHPERPGWLPFVEFLGVQVVLFGTMPLVLLPWVLRNARPFWQVPITRVCFCLFAVPILFFLQKAFQKRLEGNWALVAYLSFWPLAVVWLERLGESPMWRRLYWASFAPPLIASGLALVHLMASLPLLSPHADRISRQSGKLVAMQNLAQALREEGLAFTFETDSYQLTALARYYGLDAYQRIEGTKPSHFTRSGKRPGLNGAWWTLTEQEPVIAAAVDDRTNELVVRSSVFVRGEVVRELVARPMGRMATP
jgi:4-amino-4-deoxy-L-arabinose transferase-like glycosyltransferase